jgi:SAM-dependent MidA family methyltransferase
MGEAETVIRDEIARNGNISVARFMELALYHPDHGYYRRRRDPFGRGGDFYTAEQLQPVFGELIASYAHDLAQSVEWECPFSVLELGAGRGEMRSALNAWNYRGFDWTGDPLPPAMCGLALANEFFDALPVHLLRKNNGRWQELGVGLLNDKLTITVLSAAASELTGYAHRFGSSIPDGGLLEVNLGASSWIRRLSQIHLAGTLVVIDYGYSERELARLPEGTLMTYRRHQASADFLSHPGERDITAHVNFSYLKELAVQCGYVIERDCSLNTWIMSIWDESAFSRRWQEKDERWRLQWKELFFGMGETFRVLQLRKSCVPKEKALGINRGPVDDSAIAEE